MLTSLRDLTDLNMSDGRQWDVLTSLRDLTDLNMSDGRQWDLNDLNV